MTTRDHDARVLATPRARHRARELGVVLSNVVSTGPDGRICAADVIGQADIERNKRTALRWLLELDVDGSRLRHLVDSAERTWQDHAPSCVDYLVRLTIEASSRHPIVGLAGLPIEVVDGQPGSEARACVNAARRLSALEIAGARSAAAEIEDVPRLVLYGACDWGVRPVRPSPLGRAVAAVAFGWRSQQAAAGADSVLTIAFGNPGEARPGVPEFLQTLAAFVEDPARAL